MSNILRFAASGNFDARANPFAPWFEFPSMRAIAACAANRQLDGGDGRAPGSRAQATGKTGGTRRLALLYGQLSTDSAKVYELVTKARQAYPDDPDIAKTLGILNYRRGYYPRAGELLKQAIAQRKNDPELLYYLGEVRHQLKQWDVCKRVL